MSKTKKTPESPVAVLASGVKVYCLHSKLIPLDELVPHPRNPNKHPQKQVELLAKIIEKQGWRNPIVVSLRSGLVTKGHGRLMAAKLLRMSTGEQLVPVEYQSYPSLASENADLVADNKISELSQQDPLLVRELASEVFAFDQGFDFNLFGGFSFTPDDTSLAGPSGATVSPEKEFSKKHGKELSRLCTSWCADMDRGLKLLRTAGLISMSMSKDASEVLFLRALEGLGGYPRTANIPFHPHWVDVAGGGTSDETRCMSLLFQHVLEGKVKPERLLFAMGGVLSYGKLLVRSLPVAGHRPALDFPVGEALALIDEFCNDKAALLDPCHGWGGRLVGFLLSKKGRSYTGIDPSPETSRGVHELYRRYAKHVSGKSAKLLEQCYEDTSLAPGSFDFAFTSPPYFDVEKYTGKKTSFRRFTSFEKWCEGFYRVLLEKTFAALRPGAVFALQVGNQTYPLVERGESYGKKAGFRLEGRRVTQMRNTKEQTDFEEGEQTLILRKP